MVQGKAESVFIPLLAKSFPTLELIGKLVPQLAKNHEVDASILFQAADTAIRRNSVWFSISSSSSSNDHHHQQSKIIAHCDPEYVSTFQDAVAQSTRQATPTSPQWKDVLERVGMRAATPHQISNFVPIFIKKYLNEYKHIFDWYTEMHHNIVDSTLNELDRLAEMRIADLRENQELVQKQNHQVQQLRLCLQL